MAHPNATMGLKEVVQELTHTAEQFSDFLVKRVADIWSYTAKLMHRCLCLTVVAYLASQECIWLLAPFLTVLIISSLFQGLVPECMKVAIISNCDTGNKSELSQ